MTLFLDFIIVRNVGLGVNREYRESLRYNRIYYVKTILNKMAKYKRMSRFCWYCSFVNVDSFKETASLSSLKAYEQSRKFPLCVSQVLIKANSIGRSKGAPGSKFFQFHAVFGEKMTN